MEGEQSVVAPAGEAVWPRPVANRRDYSAGHISEDALVLRSGHDSAHKLELELEPQLSQDKGDGIRRTVKYRGYEIGRRVPQREAGSKYAVDVAEARYPGSRWYFETPMWAVLNGEKLSINVIDRGLRELGSAVSVVLEGPPSTWSGEPRFKDVDAHHADILVEMGTFEAFVAVVLLLAKSEAIGLPELRELMFNAYYALLPKIEQLELVKPFAEELFRFVDLSCKHWVFVTTQSRMDVIIFSDEVRRQVAAKEAEQRAAEASTGAQASDSDHASASEADRPTEGGTASPDV